MHSISDHNRAWLEIFKPHNGGYKIHGTRFHYFPGGRRLIGVDRSVHNERRWWRRDDDRVLRPVSIDTVMKELPPEYQEIIIWNIGKFKD